MRHQSSQPNVDERATASLVLWRRRRLERAGFEAQLAEKLSSDLRFDLHALLGLIDRGCPPQLAARILAPLDDRPAEPN